MLHYNALKLTFWKNYCNSSLIVRFNYYSFLIPEFWKLFLLHFIPFCFRFYVHYSKRQVDDLNLYPCFEVAKSRLFLNMIFLRIVCFWKRSASCNQRVEFCMLDLSSILLRLGLGVNFHTWKTFCSTS